MCFHVGFDQEVDDLHWAERLCGFIGLTANKGTAGGYGVSVPDDARDLHSAICKDVLSEFERDATICAWDAECSIYPALLCAVLLFVLEAYTC